MVSVYTAPAWPSSALPLANTTLRVLWEPGARDLVQEHLERLKLAEDHLADTKKWRHAVPTDREPMPHQWQAIRAALHLPSAVGARIVLADDMGLGKTATSLWIAASQGAERILVLCPVSVKFNWAAEIKKTLNWPTVVIDGNPKRRASLFAEAVNMRDHAKMCLVINYDQLIYLNDFQVGFLAGLCSDQVLICDESHYVKGREAQRTKFVMKWFAPAKGGARWRMLLTGTPIRNTVEDLWAQVQICRPGTWTSYWDFAKRHLVISRTDFGGMLKRPTDVVRGGKDLEGLNQIVNTLQIRRKKEDVLNLPPKIHTYPELELEGDMKRLYKAMKHLAVLALDQLDDDTLIFHPQARSAVLAALRCEQIAQGFCGGVPEELVEQLAGILTKKAVGIPGRPREILFPDHPKQVWMRENLHTLFGTGKKPVVFSRFNAPLHWMYAHYVGEGKRVGFLHGSISSKNKGQLVADFQDNKFDLFLCQVLMAEGFNLHNSQDAIFLSRDWSPAVNFQAEDRLHRIGQKGTVNIQIPWVRGTIETLIHKKLRAKDADAQQALRTVTIRELREAL
jgi:SNF2 family DNA or RNA helicase